jgi:hypothetical protein
MSHARPNYFSTQRNVKWGVADPGALYGDDAPGGGGGGGGGDADRRGKGGGAGGKGTDSKEGSAGGTHRVMLYGSTTQLISKLKKTRFAPDILRPSHAHVPRQHILCVWRPVDPVRTRKYDKSC